MSSGNNLIDLLLSLVFEVSLKEGYLVGYSVTEMGLSALLFGHSIVLSTTSPLLFKNHEGLEEMIGG